MTISVSTIRRFYDRWLMALSTLFAARRSKLAGWRLLLRRDADGIDIFENDGGRAVHVLRMQRDAPAPSAKFARGSKGVVMRMSHDDVIERIVQIPKAASDVIEPVLRNQMNKIVPWPQDETCYGFEVLGANAQSPDQLDIRIAATRKSLLNTRCEEVKALGCNPEIVDYAPDLKTNTGIELLSLIADPRRKIARILHLSLICLVVTAILLGSFGFYQLWLRSAESAAMHTDILAARERIAVLTRSRAENEKMTALRSLLSKRKAELPAVIFQIEALSRALPDTAFLTELRIQGADVRLAGMSKETPALIAAIEGSEQFGHAHFAAPTTRAENNVLESFAIVAKAKSHPLIRDESDNGK